MKKSIGLTSVFCISAGAMISSGLFVLPGLAFLQAGPAVPFSYFLAGCVALTTVLSLSELVTAMPKAGGDYFYVSRSFGQLFGTVSGMLSWLALALKSAFAIFGIAEIAYLSLGINLTLSAVILTILFTALNLSGVKEAVRFQIVLVIGLLGILAAFCLTASGAISVQRFDPFLSHGLNAVFSTAGFVFVSFGGVLTTASIAGEIRNPSRNIPLGLVASTVTVTVFYVVVTFAVVGVVDTETLAGSLAPVALAAQECGGKILYMAVILASLLAFITTANGGILTASRYPIALARDDMLPGVFAATSKKRGTPVSAILATGGLILLSILLRLEILIKAASTVILLSNIFAHLSLIVMRESKIANYRPSFKAPFYPWLQVFGIIAFVLLIIDMGLQPILLSLLFIVVGVVLYFVRRDKTQLVSPALQNLVMRTLGDKGASHELANELRVIIKDRDGIVSDDFDEAIEASFFLEIEEQTVLDKLWPRIAAPLSKRISSITASQLEELLRAREAESTTALNDFAAVPHVIIESNAPSTIGLVRCKAGIRFSEECPAVKAIFVLAGPRQQRHFHLRALAAIAQVLQEPDFEEKWLSAGSHRELMDLFLLAKRHRN